MSIDENVGREPNVTPPDNELIELMLNAWHKYNHRTGKHVTFIHYLSSTMCKDCRDAYKRDGEKHLPKQHINLRQYQKHPNFWGSQ